jgi:hypothetical protein
MTRPTFLPHPPLGKFGFLLTARGSPRGANIQFAQRVPVQQGQPGTAQPTSHFNGNAPLRLKDVCLLFGISVDDLQASVGQDLPVAHTLLRAIGPLANDRFDRMVERTWAEAVRGCQAS